MRLQDFLRAQAWLDEHTNCWRGGNGSRITLVTHVPNIVKSYVREFNSGHGYEDGIDYSCEYNCNQEDMRYKPFLTEEDMHVLGVY